MATDELSGVTRRSLYLVDDSWMILQRRRRLVGRRSEACRAKKEDIVSAIVGIDGRVDSENSSGLARLVGDNAMSRSERRVTSEAVEMIEELPALLFVAAIDEIGSEAAVVNFRRRRSLVVVIDETFDDATADNGRRRDDECRLVGSTCRRIGRATTTTTTRSARVVSNKRAAGVETELGALQHHSRRRIALLAGADRNKKTHTGKTIENLAVS